jgi:hypothetical protein
MAAIEVLNDPELAWLKNSFARVSLVTMGSPLTNLYQYYFRHLYPPLTHRSWKELKSRVDRWINIFRIDDYVGNEIDFPAMTETARPLAFSAAAPPPAFTNHAVGLRGHVLYWCDRQVLEILKSEIFRDDSVERAVKAAA